MAVPTVRSVIAEFVSSVMKNLTNVWLRQCMSNGDKATPLYTWTVDRLMKTGQWRPELSVCTSSSCSPDLLIPRNTLWYGTYRVNVTVSTGVECAPASLDRSAPATTYVTGQGRGEGFQGQDHVLTGQGTVKTSHCQEQALTVPGHGKVFSVTA